jgi:hypothetical protein
MTTIKKYIIKPIAWLLLCPLATCLTYVGYRQKGVGHEIAFDKMIEVWVSFK